MAHSHLLTFFALILVGLASTPLIGQNCAFSACFDNDCGDLNVGFSPLGGPQFCEGQLITLSNSSTPGFDFFVVDWRDGNVDTLYNYDEFQHIYNIVDSLVCVGPSVRAFSLCFKGQKDCDEGLSCQSGTYDFGIIVRPEAGFSVPSSVCVGSEFTFINSSCNSDDFLWEFGDGQTSTETNPSHEYSEPGIYQVTLSAVNQCSSDDFTATIEVVEEPEAAFELDFDSASGCVPTVVEFINQSNQWSQTQWSIQPNDTLLWVFTDTNMTFNWTDIEVLFMEPGEYLIELTASNACGENTFLDTVEIFEDLNIVADPLDPFCEEVTITPGDLGVIFGGSIDSVHWTFINGSYSTAEGEDFPPVTFSESGEIILEVWGPCGDTSLNFLTTIVTGEIVFGNNPEEVCQNEGIIELVADPPGGEWSGPGITDPALGLFDPSLLQGGNTYSIFYTFDVSPCEIEDQIEISIIEPEEGSFSTPVLCEDSDPVELEANPSGGMWFGEGIVNSLSGLFDPTFAGPGIYDITYQFTDGNGCVVEVINELLVEEFPELSLVDTLLLCVDDSEVELSVLTGFQANPGGGSTSWSGPGVVNPSGTFNSAGMNLGAGFIVVQVVYERNECVIEDSLVIELIDKTELNLSFTDTLVCIAEGNLQLAAFPQGGMWSGPGINSTTGSIDLDVAGGGIFEYEYLFQQGTTCELSGTVSVEIIDLQSELEVNPNESICFGPQTHTLAAPQPATGSWSGPGIVNEDLGIIDLSGLEVDRVYEYEYCIESIQLPGCTACQVREFIIHSEPIVSFEVDDILCIYENFQLSNTSQNGNSFMWDFGDGNTSTAESPEHRYNQSGSYLIFLEVMSDDGCEGEYSAEVEVVVPPEVEFEVDENEGCEPFELILDNQSGGYQPEYSWIIGSDTLVGENPGPLTLYTSGEDSLYKVKLVASNICGLDFTEREVWVYPTPQAEFGLSEPSGCSPFELFFANVSVGNPDSYFWDFGNGNIYQEENPPSQVYITTDSAVSYYTVTLALENECGLDTHSREIVVYPPNVFAFIESPEPEACQPHLYMPGSFSTPGSHLNWEVWLEGDLIAGSSERFPEFFLEDAGDYTIVLRASNCGSDTDTTRLRILPAPMVDFEVPDQVCLGDSVVFENLTENGVSPRWDFGDGNQSNLISPLHFYEEEGVYQVTLEMENPDNGCTAEIVKEVAVVGKPEALFESDVSSGCPPLRVNFTNNTLGFGNLEFVWKFGDGSAVDFGEDVSHVFNNPGTYTVSLIAYDENLCFSDTFKQEIVVHPVPIADFSYLDRTYCHRGDSLILSNESVDAESFEWHIGGNTLSEWEPIYFIEESGDLEVILVVQNNFQCTDSLLKIIPVEDSPIANFEFGPEEGCPELEVEFQNTSSFGTRYFWNLGDGNTTQQISPVHLYENEGNYQVSLRVENDSGCPADEAYGNIVVYPQPYAGFDFAVEEECTLPAAMNFQNSSTPDIQYQWDFGDGGSSDLTDPRHSYTDTGWYEVVLWVENEWGCSDQIAEMIEIGNKPVGDFSFREQLCAGEVLRLHNQSTYARSYIWNLEGIGTFQSEHPEWLMDQPGLYDIELIAIFNDNCRDTLYLPDALEVFETPRAAFDYDADVDDQLLGDVQFHNESERADRFLWDFGDGQFSQEIHPFHEYDLNRPLSATLIAYNDNGGRYTCVDSASREVAPEWITTFYAPNSMAPEYGPGDVRFFKPVGMGIEEYEISVYSPWGEQVWHSTALEDHSPSDYWDGSFKGKTVPQGAYVWVARIIYVNGVSRIERGTVTVLR